MLKPSELAPLSCLLLGELCTEAGLPNGALNVVSGGRATGAALAEHPDVDKVQCSAILRHLFTTSLPY